MMIDWSFIRAREGFTLKGYVPEPDKSHSGVTVATGVDIGNMTNTTFLALPAELQNLFEPYLGLIGMKANAEVLKRPLVITQEQADFLDHGTQTRIAGEVEAEYNSYSTVKFETIPNQAQTVETSVTYQYGVLKVKAPRFFACMTHQDWKAAVQELRNFGDAYTTRRNLEADLLKQIV